jgi:O-antigen ligase
MSNSDSDMASPRTSWLTSAALAVIPVALYLPIGLFNVVFISCCAIVLIQVVRLERNSSDWKLLLTLILPFFALVPGLIIDASDGNVYAGVKYLESFLPLLFFPLLIYFSDATSEDFQRIKKVFFYGSLIVGLYLLAFACWKNFTDHERIVQNWSFADTIQFYEKHPIGFINWGFFLYSEFTRAIGFHPIYLGIYFCVALIFGFELLRHGNRRIRVGVLIGIGILAFDIVLINGRLPIIALGIILAAYLFYFFILARARLAKVLITVITLLLLSLAFVFPQMIYRVTDTIAAVTSEDDSQITDNSLQRILFWKAGVNILRQQAGTTGIGLVAGERSIDARFPQMQPGVVNTHNQWLMLAISGGVLAIMVLAFAFYLYVRRAILKRSMPYLLFLIVILLILLTENFLSRHHGVTVFAFFNSLFIVATTADSRGTLR